MPLPTVYPFARRHEAHPIPLSLDTINVKFVLVNRIHIHTKGEEITRKVQQIGLKGHHTLLFFCGTLTLNE